MSKQEVETCWKDLSQNYMTLDEFSNQVIAPRYGSKELELIKNLSVSVCFLVDCTYSMNPWIEMVKERIEEIRESLHRELPFSPKFAFIGYRDIGDAEIVCVLDFPAEDTDNATQAFIDFLTGTSAKGGGDLAESVHEGLHAVTKLHWTTERRILYHIADAPCHGSQFHDLPRGATYDKYYDGIPEALNPKKLDIAELATNIGEMKIKYLFCEINSTTTKMIEKFKLIYERVPGHPYKLIVKHINHATRDLVNDVVRESLCAGPGMPTSIEIFNHDSAIPKWNNIQVNNARIYKYRSDSLVQIKIATQPFAEGATRFAYYGQLVEDRKLVVLKMWKGIDRAVTENRCIQQQRCHEKADLLLGMSNKCLTYYLIQEYDRLGLKGRGWKCPRREEAEELLRTIRDVKVLPMHYVQFLDGTHKGYCFTIEDYMPGEFVKYNNNTSYVKELSDPNSVIAQIFSHVSLVTLTILSMIQGEHNTEMVADIQGVGLHITDPVVHSTSMGMQYGNTNLGTLGIREFFTRHNTLGLKCCTILGTFNCSF